MQNFGSIIEMPLQLQGQKKEKSVFYKRRQECECKWSRYSIAQMTVTHHYYREAVVAATTNPAESCDYSYKENQEKWRY